MTASDQIFLVVDASPKAAFTTRRELKAYLRRRLDTFINPMVYTFWGNQGPVITTLSAALAEPTQREYGLPTAIGAAAVQ